VAICFLGRGEKEKGGVGTWEKSVRGKGQPSQTRASIERRQKTPLVGQPIGFLKKKGKTGMERWGNRVCANPKRTERRHEDKEKARKNTSAQREEPLWKLKRRKGPGPAPGGKKLRKKEGWGGFEHVEKGKGYNHLVPPGVQGGPGSTRETPCVRKRKYEK